VKKAKTVNPELIGLAHFLKSQGRENKAEIWSDLAERLIKPRRKRIAVNLSRLNRYTKRNDMVVVPGKVLASGEITHPIKVTAFTFSAKAREKIADARGKCLSFPDLVKKNPKGSNVKIIG
jgi:large subunit ribosomal protein L18e